jgi:TolB protein
MFDHKREKSRTRIGAIAIAAILLMIFLLGAPRVSSFQPTSGSTMVPSTTEIRIKFNQPMDKVSVETRINILPEAAGRFVWQGNVVRFIPEQPWPPGERITVDLSAGARSSYFIPILRQKTWSFEIGVPRIIYIDTSQGKSSLQIRTPEFDETSMVTERTTEILDFSVSDDGTMVVYTAAREDAGSDLYLIDLISEEEQRLQECPSPIRCQNPHLSPNKDWIIFEQVELQAGVGGNWITGSPHLFLLNLAQGSEEMQIGQQNHPTSDPAWSPLGDLAYYNATTQEIVIVDLRVANAPKVLDRIPSALGNIGNWSPEGDFLLFPDVQFLDETYEKYELTGDEFSLFYSHIFRFSMSTGLVTDLTGQEFGLVEDATPTYSPDGLWLAFTRKYLEGNRWTPGRQVWVMRSDGSQARQITQESSFNHFSLSWSPDSSQIAFVRADQDDLASQPEIWLYNLMTEELSFVHLAGYLPHWLP